MAAPNNPIHRDAGRALRVLVICVFVFVGHGGPERPSYLGDLAVVLAGRLGACSRLMLLSSDLWVSALIRRADQAGAFAVVVRKGDPRAGAVLVKVVNRAAGATRLYAEATRMDGEQIWMQPAGSDQEPDLDKYIERAIRIDPDLWVVEIDDRDGRHFLTEPVEAI